MSPLRLPLSLMFTALFLFVGRASADCEKPAGNGKENLVKRIHKDGPRWLKDGLSWVCQREFTEVLLAVLGGSTLGPGEGWFHPAQSRYSWKWLADRFGVDPEEGQITRAEWKGPAELFERLDRDGSGAITAADFDWSERSPFVRQSMEASRLFYKFDQNSNGRVSRREWDNLFNKLAKGKDHFTPEDLRELFKQPPPPKKKDKSAMGPSPAILLQGLLTGELGSFFEGPRIGERAPAFKLPTHDGKKEISLGQFRGQKPVVLIFGSFTWGPFRSQFGVLENLHQRYKDRVQFLAVYVREAHPTDGWRVPFNDKVGISIQQPKTGKERTKVAEQCCTTLEITMPLLVDGLDDRVGHAYSGMPDRLFVIDRQGKVTYKGGRGPFGFKPGEMEQSLIMTLLEDGAAPAAATQ